MSTLVIDGELIKFIGELYGLDPFIFMRNLEKQCLELNLNICEELKKRNSKKVLVVGPGISPCVFQLANQIEDAQFIALDNNRNCLDLTKSIIGVGKPSRAIRTNKNKISDETKSRIKKFTEAYVETAKDIMTNAPLWPVKNPEDLYERFEFMHGDLSHLPYRNLDAILAFNIIQHLSPIQIYKAFHSIGTALARDGFFIASSNIQKLYTGYISLSKENRYHFFFEIIRSFEDRSYRTLSLKKVIPEDIKWDVKKSERYWYVLGEKV